MITPLHHWGSLGKSQKAENPRGRLSVAISLVAILISVISAYYAYQQGAIIRRGFSQHVPPKIKVELAYPAASTGSEVNYGNLEFVVTNPGPTSVASVAIDFRCYIYSTTLKKVTSVMYMSDSRQTPTFYRKNLDPDESVKIQLPGYQGQVPQTLVDVYWFDMRYYQAPDLEEYNRTEIFFVEGKEISRHEAFMASPHYGDIMRAISPKGNAQVGGERPKSLYGRWWELEK
jgi:hypothetical protein